MKASLDGVIGNSAQKRQGRGLPGMLPSCLDKPQHLLVCLYHPLENSTLSFLLYNMRLTIIPLRIV